MDLDGWHPDPFGIHEARLFTQGKPTALVKDDGIGSLDAPPITERHVEGAARTAGQHLAEDAPAGMMSVGGAGIPPEATCSDLAMQRLRHHRNTGASANQVDSIRPLSPPDPRLSIVGHSGMREAVKYRTKALQAIALVLTALGILVGVFGIAGFGETTRSVQKTTTFSPPVRALRALPPPATLTALERALRELPRSTTPATTSSQGSSALAKASVTPVNTLSPGSISPGSTESVAPTTMPPSTTASTTGFAPSTTSPAPDLTSIPASVTAPPTTRPSATVRAVPSPAVGQGANAQVAAGLIRAVNQQSNRTKTIPVSADNVSLLESWIGNEGGLWADNPLNTSLDSAAYPHQFTTSGQDTDIPIFPNMALGIAATARTLLSNPSYARILSVLKSGRAPCVSFATAVIQSPWASSHYGHDPARFCSGIVPPVRLHHRHHRSGHRR